MGSAAVVHRIRQWQRSLRPHVTPSDRTFTATLLTPVEEQLFYQMAPADQRHCLDVTYELLEMLGLAGADPGAAPHKARAVDPKLMLRAGLLHDVGKGGERIPLAARVLFSLFSRTTLERFFPGETLVGRAVRVLAGHPGRGAWMTRTFGLGEDLARVIESHHDPAVQTAEVLLLRVVDGRN